MQCTGTLKGGKGGGAVNITATEVTINGIVKSNGENGVGTSSAGSGGKRTFLWIYILKVC